MTASLTTACLEPEDAPDVGEQASAAVVNSPFVRTAFDTSYRQRFLVNGAVFRFIGANMNELPWMSPGDQDAELDWARDTGFKVVRVWGVDSGEGVAAMTSRLRAVLDRAKARGLYVTIALTHNYRQPNWVKNYQTQPACKFRHAVPGDAVPNPFTTDPRGFYTRYCGTDSPGGDPCNGEELYCLDDRWVDWGYGAHYRGYAEQLAASLADHTAIFSWDIANEVSSSASGDMVQQLAELYVDMAARIKAADRNHMVTTGMISSSWASMSDAHRKLVYDSPNLDYLTVHEYDGDGGDTYDLYHQNDEIWRAHRFHGKPIVVEEFGVRRGTPAATKTEFINYYERRFNHADPNFQVAGIMHWGLTSFPWGYDGKWSPQALGIFTWAVDFWRGWSARLAAESTTPACLIMDRGATMGPGSSRGSCDGLYQLAYQTDNNLVVYRNGGTAQWASCTNGRAPSLTAMQTDGNLVVYNSGAPWSSQTAGNAGARLYFEGNKIAVRSRFGDRLWSSATWCR